MQIKKEEIAKALEKCCVDLEKGQECNILDFHYRMVNVTKVGNQSVPVEVLIHARLEKCTEGLELGKLIYSTTLFPGEKVKLFTMDRRSRFSFDKETNLSYRNEQTHESQYYMASMDSMMSDLTISNKGENNSASSGDFATSGGTSGIIGTLISGPSVSVEGNYNAAATSDFTRELSRHAEASHNRSVEATHTSSSVSMGEVQTRSHAEGETENHFEASSRSFTNENKCHAVTYFFYQINEKQRMKFEIVSIKRRVVDAAANTLVTNKRFVSNGDVTVLPAVIKADNPKRLEIQERVRLSKNIELGGFNSFNQGGFNYAAAPLTYAGPVGFIGNDLPNIQPDAKLAALKQVDNELIAVGLLDKQTNEITREVRNELSFEVTTSLPTGGLKVQSCLDECSVCETSLEREIELNLEQKQLQNELLKKQIELLEKSQEYRECIIVEAIEEEA